MSQFSTALIPSQFWTALYTVCTTTDWDGFLLFKKPLLSGPIFTTPAVAKDSAGKYWIFWGTGNKAYPNGASVSWNGSLP